MLSACFCAELLKEACEKVCPGKVTAIVTDNAACMRAARQLLLKQEEYAHILEMRGVVTAASSVCRWVHITAMKTSKSSQGMSPSSLFVGA